MVDHRDARSESGYEGHILPENEKQNCDCESIWEQIECLLIQFIHPVFAFFDSSLQLGCHSLYIIAPLSVTKQLLPSASNGPHTALNKYILTSFCVMIPIEPSAMTTTVSERSGPDGYKRDLDDRIELSSHARTLATSSRSQQGEHREDAPSTTVITCELSI